MPYLMTTYKVLELLQVDPECGVRSQEIDARRAQYGANEFEEEKKESVFSMFLDQLRDPMIIILLAGAFISAFLRELVDAGIIVAVIALNALIGVMQQYRSEKALEALAQPFYYSVTVRDRTRLRRTLWDRADEDTLTGLFLQAMARRRDSARTEEEKAVVEEAVRFGLAALEHREDPR